MNINTRFLGSPLALEARITAVFSQRDAEAEGGSLFFSDLWNDDASQATLHQRGHDSDQVERQAGIARGPGGAIAGIQDPGGG